MNFFSVLPFGVKFAGGLGDKAGKMGPNFMQKFGLLLAGPFIIKMLKLLGFVAIIVVAVIIAIIIYKKFIKK